MVRKLALAVSLALGTLSVPVHALGLGDLNSKSTLNQNFSGDITLLSVAPEELDAARKSWQGRFELVPSVTDAESATICNSATK